jgi:hypothetical protein
VSREIALHHLLGRMVHDAAGRRVGRIEELRAEILVDESGSDYVVTEFHVGSFGAMEALGGARFPRLLLRRLGPLAPYRLRHIPWHQMDLSDPRTPRLRPASSDSPDADSTTPDQPEAARS